MGLVHLSKSGNRKRVYIPDSDWHEIGDPGEPAFTSGWGNHGGSYGTAAFRLDAEGWVHLKGVVTRSSGTSWIPFALPASHTPVEFWYRTSVREPTSVGDRFGCQIDISNVNGNVTVNTFSNLYPERVILDGVKFPLYEQEYNYKGGIGDDNTGTMVGTGTAATYPGTYFNGSGIWNSIWKRDSDINTIHLYTPFTATTTYTWTWDGFESPRAQMLPYYSRTESERCRYLEVSNRRAFYTSTAKAISQTVVDYFGEKAHESMIEPSLSNSWVEYGKDTYNSWEGVGYLKDKHGFVHLKGLVKSGSSASAVMFTLPTGYRPSYDVYHIGMSYATITDANYATIIKVGSNGEVSAYYGGSTTYTSISGVSFYAG